MAIGELRSYWRGVWNRAPVLGVNMSALVVLAPQKHLRARIVDTQTAATQSDADWSYTRSNRMARLTSSIASVTFMSRGHASVQLNAVRQRNTPDFSFRMSRR